MVFLLDVLINTGLRYAVYKYHRLYIFTLQACTLLIIWYGITVYSFTKFALAFKCASTHSQSAVLLHPPVLRSFQ